MTWCSLKFLRLILCGEAEALVLRGDVHGAPSAWQHGIMMESGHSVIPIVFDI